ncbi:HK97 gp10 family phage protein [Pasteurella testudinis]|uniref:HK97 gp10 family phage protein n=1 Tax=Pasteurella testudinis TaxID=761 RepID=UPI000DF9E53F|nr:HK97 gp10 family phage protein [Pasteurella testudinis]SUB51635.1 Uncharacterised protein [Pasteurella testudinis]
MAIKVSGIKETKQRLSALIGEIQATRSVRAITRAITIGAIKAAEYTPIDTSTLINSQYKQVSNRGTLVVGHVGYSAEYAMAVHDPRIKQTFRRATAKKEFLKKGFEDTKDEMQAAIKEELGKR